MVRRPSGKVAARLFKGAADAAKSCGTRKMVRTVSAMLGAVSSMPANAQVNRRQCEALTSELNLQLGSTAFAHWGVTCACALNPAPYSMHICLKLRAKVLLKCAFLGLNLKAIHVCNECWEQCQCDQV